MTSLPDTSRSAASQPLWKWLLLAEAAFWLLVARASLLLVPFPRIGRYLGTLQPPAPFESALDDEQATLARRIGWAVNKAGESMVLEMVCLPRALAAWQMLHRRGIPSRLHFGALKEPDPTRKEKLQTHAWLSSSEVHLTGYPVAYGCVELGYFSRPPAGASKGDGRLRTAI